MMTCDLSRLVVSANNPHLLETISGIPYWVLGDTAWELFHRTVFEEAHRYLNVRAEQGFNMIWANILAEFGGLHTPNRYGYCPFGEDNPSKPIEEYFLYVDQLVQLASSLGLYVGLLPAWGDKLTAPWGEGPAVFSLDNLDVSLEYGRWLGERYAKCSNVIWVLGGDRPARLFGTDEEYPMTGALAAGIARETDWTPIWRSMASGIKEGGATQLMTYHPQGGTASSSQFLHSEPWLDINAIQSGHGGGHDVPIWESVARDYELVPTKPTMDAEPNYEDHPVNPWPAWDPVNGYFDDYDVRKQLYRSIFAGGCGAIYGHHSVWQFASEFYEAVNYSKCSWIDAVRRPGAEQIRYLRALLYSIDLGSAKPDQSILRDNAGVGGDHARVMRSKTGAMVYVPTNRSIRLFLEDSISGPVRVEQFCPATGVCTVPQWRQDGVYVVVAKSEGSDRSDRVIIVQAAG